MNVRLTAAIGTLIAATVLATSWAAAQSSGAAATSAAPTATALTPSEAAGKAVVLNRKLGNCLACHTMPVSDVPSTVGPPLKNIKAQFPDRTRLEAVLNDEQSLNPQTVMPLFGKNLILDHKQIEEVIDYLYTF